MADCYYYIERLPGVSLEDSYIRKVCEQCCFKNNIVDAWFYSGPMPSCEIKCNICGKQIYDGKQENCN